MADDFDEFTEKLEECFVDGEAEPVNTKMSDDEIVEIANKLDEGDTFLHDTFIDIFPYSVPLDDKDKMKGLPSTFDERLKKNGYKLRYKILNSPDDRVAVSFNLVELTDDETDEFRDRYRRWHSDGQKVNKGDITIYKIYCNKCGKRAEIGMLDDGEKLVPVAYCDCIDDEDDYVLLDNVEGIDDRFDVRK